MNRTKWWSGVAAIGTLALSVACASNVEPDAEELGKSDAKGAGGKGACFDPGPPLTIATEGAYEPFNYRDAAGELVGIDIDYMNAICDKLGRQCAFVTAEWGDGCCEYGGVEREPSSTESPLFSMLSDGSADILAASTAVNANRATVYTMSAPVYAAAYIGIVAKEGTSLDVSLCSGLDGVRVAAQDGTVLAKYLAARYPEAVFVPVAEQADVFAALDGGSADAAILNIDFDGIRTRLARPSGAPDRLVLATLGASDPGDVASRDPEGYTRVFGPGTALMIRNDYASLPPNADLLEKIDCAIHEINAALNGNGEPAFPASLRETYPNSFVTAPTADDTYDFLDSIDGAPALCP